MKSLVLAAAAVVALTVQVEASPFTVSDTLPSSASGIFAPVPSYTNAGFGSAGYETSYTGGNPFGVTYVGLTTSYPNVARSPFDTVPTLASAPFTSVSGGATACFGFCETAQTDVRSLFVEAPATFTGGSSFSFIYGSPDGYNTLTIFSSDGIFTYGGGDIVSPTTGAGYKVVTYNDPGAAIFGVQFAGTTNAFEIAAISAVPLPASLPMFGAALLAVAAVGYGVKRKNAAVAV